MKFLTKLGQILLKATEIVTGFGPLVGAAFPQGAAAYQVVSRDLAQVAQIVAQAEAMGQVLGTPGADKAKAVAPLVAQIVLQSSMLANHDIHDSTLFLAGCQQIGAGMADVLNALKDKIPTENKA